MPSIVLSWGAIGVAIFFFVSGYGNCFSIKRCKEVKEKVKWFFTKSWNLLRTFIFCYVVVIIVLALNSKEGISIECVMRDFIALRMPETSTWYLKIQILFYLFRAISACIFAKLSTMLFVLSIGYAAFFYYIGMPDYWWMTSLCFVTGVWFAENKETLDKIAKKHRVGVIAGGIVGFALSYILNIMVDSQAWLVKLCLYACICVSIVFVVVYSNIDSVIYQKIGTISLEIYLIHIGLITSLFRTDVNYHVLCFVYIVLVSALSISVHLLVKKLDAGKKIVRQ